MRIIPEDLLSVLNDVMDSFRCGISEATCSDENSLILQPLGPNNAGPSEGYVVSFLSRLCETLEFKGMADKYKASLDVLCVGGNIYRIKIVNTGV